MHTKIPLRLTVDRSLSRHLTPDLIYENDNALLLPVLAYLLLLRLYGRTLDPEQGASLFALKQRFAEEVAQEHLEHTERKWRRKLEQVKAA